MSQGKGQEIGCSWTNTSLEMICSCYLLHRFCSSLGNSRCLWKTLWNFMLCCLYMVWFLVFVALWYRRNVCLYTRGVESICCMRWLIYSISPLREEWRKCMPKLGTCIRACKLFSPGCFKQINWGKITQKDIDGPVQCKLLHKLEKIFGNRYHVHICKWSLIC